MIPRYSNLGWLRGLAVGVTLPGWPLERDHRGEPGPPRELQPGLGNGAQRLREERAIGTQRAAGESNTGSSNMKSAAGRWVNITI